MQQMNLLFCKDRAPETEKNREMFMQSTNQWHS